jgi:hypothetical protein
MEGREQIDTEGTVVERPAELGSARRFDRTGLRTLASGTSREHFCSRT